MNADLGVDFAGAFAAMVETTEALPGQFNAEFSLTFWAGVTAGAEPWQCRVEGDIHGDGGDSFVVLAMSAAEALRTASAEAWRRVPR